MYYVTTLITLAPQILKNFRLEPSEKTPSPLKIRNKGITLGPENDQIFVKVAKRN
jgi:hypothetical protein